LGSKNQFELIEKKFERQEEINVNQERINAAQKEASDHRQNKLIELLEEKIEHKEKRIQQLEKEVASHLDSSDPKPVVFKSKEEPTLKNHNEMLISPLPHQMIEQTIEGHPKMGVSALKSSQQDHSISKEEPTLNDLPPLKSSMPDQIIEKNILHYANDRRHREEYRLD